jgi:type I restriction enzyme S subunit
LDRKIELQIKKVESLKLFKNGIINEIFNNVKGEKLYLKDILKKWNVRNVANKYNYVESISNKFGFISQTEQFEDRTIASRDKSNYYVIEKGVFAYNPSRLDVGSLALKKDNNTSVVSPLYECFTTNQNNVYMLEWFKSDKFKKETLSRFEGGVRNTLNFSNLSTIPIEIPDMKTQKKIRKIVFYMNTNIELEKSKLEQLNLFKKGLLQQCLFRYGYPYLFIYLIHELIL